MSDPNISPSGGKTVSFDDDPTSSTPTVTTTTTSLDSTTLPTATATESALAPAPVRPANKRRRSSLKQGTQMPYRPEKQYYSHPDPLLRRLRLRNGYGKEVDLEREFTDAKVVLFLFGATWRNSSKEPYDLVANFARRHPHQCKVVYVSADTSERVFEQNTRSKPWLAMEWNDGSTLETPGAPEDEPQDPSSTLAPTEPLEPFLLAGDPDLEDEVHHSDPKGELYLRPYSRVYLAEKWNVLGVPNVVVYHLPSRQILTHHARFDLLKDGKLESTWAKWSEGEKVEFGIGDLVFALRWTISLAVLASAYAIGVRQGAVPDVLGQWTESLSQKFLFGGTTPPS
ncbi:hypothetical protein BMF94_3608 [Rhodotorula taiwanensis]|uniref:Thioredoxin-like fold domain-containing protein n=1 Tax=Rhodotorula taiwanensis TaxID=741276 RepID=A0A2S5B920_9BASI|nr:hypothetical protein BMF94_3608 [Rhodotorula taiwanensis]